MRHGGYSTLSKADAGHELLNSHFLTRDGMQLSHYWKRMVFPAIMPRAILTNLATIEPGMFNNKRLIMKNPHGLIEGMLLCARSVGADQGYIITASEDLELAKEVDRVLSESLNENLWGDKANWSFRFKHIRLPQNALYAQDSFLLAALHAERPGYPNRKEFLYGIPVHIHRPEEFYAFNWIEKNGSEVFSKRGTPSTPGTYLITISGSLENSLVAEIPGGTALEDILELAGHAKNIKNGWFRFGGVFGHWYKWSEIKVKPFEISSGPLCLRSFQYPLMEWYDEAGAAAAKRATTYFTGQQSCGACLACSDATSGLPIWTKQQLKNFVNLAKCSFFERSVQASRGGPEW